MCINCDLCGADARGQAILALAPLAVTLRSLAILAGALPALVWAHVRPHLLTALATGAVMFAYLRPAVFIVEALL